MPRRPARRDAALTRRVREEWHKEADDSKLVITHGCDRLAETIDELIVERSSGHGHSLYLERIERQDDGSYAFVRLDYGPYGAPMPRELEARSEWDWAAADGAKVHVATIPGARVEATLRRFRAALQVQVEERVPPPPPGTLRGGGYSWSSRDFHIAYHMVDSAGRGGQGFWVGYEGSGEQARWLPLDLAREAWVELVASEELDAQLQERAPTAADRDLFAERFATARGRGDEYGYWYLRERLLGMARTLGDTRLMTDLFAIARAEGEPHAVSRERSRATAVDVLVGLTGYDPRFDAQGAPRPGAAAAADMLARCDPAGP
ncbi:MAG: hypothetical protein H6713_27285 [Myxococcales bacterium]|nr:hypothetical protein [Myxococcales bacterium]